MAARITFLHRRYGTIPDQSSSYPRNPRFSLVAFVLRLGIGGCDCPENFGGGVILYGGCDTPAGGYVNYD